MLKSVVQGLIHYHKIWNFRYVSKTENHQLVMNNSYLSEIFLENYLVTIDMLTVVTVAAMLWKQKDDLDTCIENPLETCM